MQVPEAVGGGADHCRLHYLERNGTFFLSLNKIFKCDKIIVSFVVSYAINHL